MEFVSETTMSFKEMMIKADKEENNMTETWNGALSYVSTLDSLVDLFYKGMRNADWNAMGNLLESGYKEDKLLSAKMIAYIRDVRGGKGERDLGRKLLEKMGKIDMEIFKKNIEHYIATYGRWDDGMEMSDPELKSIYLDLVVQQLKKDKEELDAKGEKAQISLCAKWVPSEGKSLDKAYGIHKLLTKKMGMNSAEIRKVYLAPLRKHLDLVETKLVKKDYENIDYEKVPSRTMHIHGKEKNKRGKENAFMRNDKDRFEEYKSKLAEGKAKVNAKTLYPHEVMETYFDGHHPKAHTPDELVEAQWRVMEEEVKKLGKLGRTLVLSDVSGSMSGLPMQISVAMGILISSCCEVEEFKDVIISFHEDPKFHDIKGANLLEKIKSILATPWGGSTNFQKVFDMILERAQKYKISEDQMPERIIVISDMQFNVAAGNKKTNFQALDEKYIKAGYKRPQMIFWNVNGRIGDVPVTADMANTGLISGYSPSIMKAVLKGQNMTPKEVMIEALTDSRYDLIELP